MRSSSFPPPALPCPGGNGASASIHGLSQPGTTGCCGITLVSTWPGHYSQDGNGGGSLPLSGTLPSFSVPKPATVFKACLVLLPGQGCKSSARAVLRYLLLDLLSAKITGVSCFFPFFFFIFFIFFFLWIC